MPTDSDRDDLINIISTISWQGSKGMLADAILAEGWRKIPTRTDLICVMWDSLGETASMTKRHIDRLIAAGFAREDDDEALDLCKELERRVTAALTDPAQPS